MEKEREKERGSEQGTERKMLLLCFCFVMSTVGRIASESEYVSHFYFVLLTLRTVE